MKRCRAAKVTGVPFRDCAISGFELVPIRVVGGFSEQTAAAISSRVSRCAYMYRGNGGLGGGVLWSRSSNSAKPLATYSWTLPWGCVKIASSSQIRRTHRVTQLARAKITALGTY